LNPISTGPLKEEVPKRKPLLSNGYKEVKEPTTSDDINLINNECDFSPGGMTSLTGYPD
jgi:hypothetical protein